jgi:hypothetical protein
VFTWIRGVNGFSGYRYNSLLLLNTCLSVLVVANTCHDQNNSDFDIGMLPCVQERQANKIISFWLYINISSNLMSD